MLSNNRVANSVESPDISSSSSNKLTVDGDEVYIGNRSLLVLADFFYDEYNHRDYERGILIKSGRAQLVGKTIVLSRNKTNHLLTAYCEISGVGIYRLSYAVTITGKADTEYIDRLFVEKQLIRDSVLYKTLKSQEIWHYVIADLEKEQDWGDVIPLL